MQTGATAAVRPRSETRQIFVGPVAVGGGAPVSVQTMTNADPHDAQALLRQINEAADLGCDIIRLTVPDAESAAVFRQVRASSPLPLVADIHFDYRLALAALEWAGLPILGCCVGHNCRIGGGLMFYPGRMVESDCVLVRSEQRAVIAKNVTYEESDHHHLPGGEVHPRLYPR